MGRTDQNPFAAGGFYPSACSLSTGEDYWVHVISLDHGEFEVAVIWRCRDSLPYGRFVHRFNLTASWFALNHPVGLSNVR